MTKSYLLSEAEDFGCGRRNVAQDHSEPLHDAGWIRRISEVSRIRRSYRRTGRGFQRNVDQALRLCRHDHLRPAVLRGPCGVSLAVGEEALRPGLSIRIFPVPRTQPEDRP